MVPISSRIRLPSLPYVLTDTQWTCATYSVSYQKNFKDLMHWEENTLHF